MASLESGKRLADRFVLLQRLGDGGHAEVWAAQDESSGQQVALKFMHLRSCSADEAWQVLQHEAQMSRRLDHPGVLRVDEPQRDGWLVFLPVEYVSGGDAAQLRGASWQRVLPVLLQVARVLEHAHSRGVVHRDIKPGNVLFDATGAVRVTDFGTALRTGSTAATSAGSPFSASPQQLRGEAATTGDDVYGLGALGYELLTRYPPFYPDFDLQRVQHEDPGQPVPAQPAPQALLDLLHTMLARNAEDRPDLQQVMQMFEHWLEVAAAQPMTGEALVFEPSSTATPPAPRKPRQQVAALWWLTGAAAVALAGFLLLPRAPATSQLPQSAPIVAPVVAVADAVIAGAAEAPATPVTAAADPTAWLAQALAAGNDALAAGQPALASAAFQVALSIDPMSEDAGRGMIAAAQLATLLADFAAATRTEARGDLSAARGQYQALLVQRADFAPARESLQRVQNRQRADEFESLLIQGAAALRQGQLQAAESAYARAAAINAVESRVLDGQARVAEVRRNRRNAEDLATGVTLEQAERWPEAVAHYRTVLERDATLLFAQDGLTRSNRRAELDLELQDYLVRPQRLSAAAVRAAAERALARGEASTPHDARLGDQLKQLRAQLQQLAAQVQVAISSDNSTHVSMGQLGELGAFHLRELELPPGHYTVIGRRDGFRDVRMELDITPGQRRAELSVQCTERI